MPADKKKVPLTNPRRRTGADRAPLEPLSLHASLDPGAPGPRLAPAPEPARLPPVTEIRFLNTTRLLPAKYSESVLTRIADDDGDLKLIFALDNATNDRLLAEGNLRLGITARELVFDVPYCRIINAAFTHPHPLGARFSMPYRGAWYAALELATAKAEVLFHRAVQFAEIDWKQPEELDYDQYTADFNGAFHDLRPTGAGRSAAGFPRFAPGDASQAKPSTTLALVKQKGIDARGKTVQINAAEEPPTAEEFAHCLALDSYIESQRLAIELLDAGSPGIVYPSTRRASGTCLACFRPSLVTNVRKRDLYRLKWYPDRAATFLRTPRTHPATETPAGIGVKNAGESIDP